MWGLGSQCAPHTATRYPTPCCEGGAHLIQLEAEPGGIPSSGRAGGDLLILATGLEDHLTLAVGTKAQRTRGAAIRTEAAGRTELWTLGIAATFRRWRRATSPGAIGAFLRIALIIGNVGTFVAGGTSLAGKAAARARAVLAGANTAAIRAALLWIAIVLGIIDAGESPRARKTGDTATEGRIGARLESGGARAVTAQADRASEGAVVTLDTRGKDVRTVVVSAAFRCPVRLAEAGAVGSVVWVAVVGRNVGALVAARAGVAGEAPALPWRVDFHAEARTEDIAAGRVAGILRIVAAVGTWLALPGVVATDHRRRAGRKSNLAATVFAERLRASTAAVATLAARRA